MTTRKPCFPPSRRFVCAGLAATAAVLQAPAIARAAAPRIVTIGCGVTETVFALGRGGDVVATDAASFLAEATGLPKLNYPKGLSAAEVLALRPDVVLVADEAGPKAALDEIAASGARYLRLPEPQRAADVPAGLRLIAEAIGESRGGAALADWTAAGLACVEEGLRGVSSRRRAVALLGAPDAYRLIVGGRGSPAGIALGFAGAENAAEAIAGWSWIAPEAVRDLDPEAVVSLSSDEPAPLSRVLAAPGLAATAACRHERVALVETAAFAGFGPRTAQAVHAVASRIYPEIAFAPPPERRWPAVRTAAAR